MFITDRPLSLMTKSSVATRGFQLVYSYQMLINYFFNQNYTFLRNAKMQSTGRKAPKEATKAHQMSHEVS